MVGASAPIEMNLRLPGAGEDWASVGGGTDEAAYSRLKLINAGNVARLGLAWSLDLPGEQMLEATPLAVGGYIYFTGTFGKVYAIDARRHSLVWTHDPQTWKVAPQKLRYNLSANRGVAYAGGRIFTVTFDGRLLALDAGTGTLDWSVVTLDPASVQTATGAPRVFDGMVIIGNGGADFGARGYVTAYDQATGRQVWRFYTAPGSPDENRGDPAMEAAAKTWTGEYWKTGTGGTVWNGITFDPELGRVYIGTGNSGPYDPRIRSPGGGDNLYLASIVALDARTGKYLWHYQVNPREAWDYKATANMALATLAIDGRPRKVLMQAPTNGFFYVIDRETGRLISAEKFGKVTWADRIDLKSGRPVERPGIRYEDGSSELWPSSLGAHNWQAMAFSAETHLAYVPAMQLGLRYTSLPPQPGGKVMGGLKLEALVKDDRDGRGSLLAWDPAAQKPRWQVWHDHLWNGGVLATAGGLVFQGTAEGTFAAWAADSGVPLWRFAAGLGIIAAPVSFQLDGQQYVAVLAGYGATNVLGGDFMNVGWKYGAQPRRLLVFALDGNAVLPKTSPASLTVTPVDDPAFKLDPVAVSSGEALFAAHCALCHGANAVSAGAPAPDLRESGIALEQESFSTVLRGALLAQGMPGFPELTETQLDQLRSYIRSRARAALAEPHNAERTGKP